MKARELELCQIQVWYPRFSSISLKTILHPLPEAFVSYLQADAFFLPPNSKALPSRRNRNRGQGASGTSSGRSRSHGASLDLDSDEEDYHRWSEGEDETEEPEEVSFPDLESEIEASIAKLGGSVFPKLNWSAPKDSAWIGSSGSLLCRNFGEICLLLKASDSLVHDLCHAFDSCEDKTLERPDQFFLALRKWHDLRPEMEFRGFVRHSLLVGISQREVTGFYPSLLESEERIERSVFEFFVENLSEAFDLKDYTFDCYVTRSGSVKLIDFNPWGAFTLPLLFTWDELEEISVRFLSELVESSEDDDTVTAIYDTGLHMKNPLICEGKPCMENVSSSDTQVHSGSSNAGSDTLMESLSLDTKTNTENALSVETESESMRKCSTESGLLSKSSCSHTGPRGGASLSSADSHADSLEMISSDSSHAEAPGMDSIHTESKSPGSHIESHPIKSSSIQNESQSKRKSSSIKLYQCGLKPEFRIVRSDRHVRVNLRMGGGVPYDYVETGPGSAWDEFLQRAGDELRQQNRDSAAGG